MKPGTRLPGYTLRSPLLSTEPRRTSNN